MPVFPAQGGSRNTWGTELRNFFSPYFTLTTGLFVTASVPGWAIDATIQWTQIVKTTASLADINNHDHSTLTSIGTNNHIAIDAFIASASTSPGASMIPITTTTSMLVLPGNVLLPNTAALKIKNATGSDWYSVVKKSSDAVYVGDVDKFATGHIYFSGTTSQNFIHAVSQTGADTVVYHGGNVGIASSIATLNASSLVVQNPASASATPGANTILMSDANSMVTVSSATSSALCVLKVIQATNPTVGLRIERVQADGDPTLQFSDTVAHAADITMKAGTNNLYSNANLIHTDGNTGLFGDYSTSSTIVGWSSRSVTSIRYCTVGKLVTVKFSISGTSNTNVLTFTVPYTAINIVNTDVAIKAEDNTVFLSSPGLAELGPNSNIVHCYKDMGGTVWTASGEKSISGVLIYEAA